MFQLWMPCAVATGAVAAAHASPYLLPGLLRSRWPPPSRRQALSSALTSYRGGLQGRAAGESYRGGLQQAPAGTTSEEKRLFVMGFEDNHDYLFQQWPQHLGIPRFGACLFNCLRDSLVGHLFLIFFIGWQPQRNNSHVPFTGICNLLALWCTSRCINDAGCSEEGTFPPAR